MPIGKKPATKSQPGYDIITTTAIELMGVGIFALLAGINDKMGSIMILLMVGFLLGWLFMHTTQLSNMVKGLHK